MDFVAQTSSDRSGLLLRKIGQRLLTHLDALSTTPVAASSDGIYTPPSSDDHQDLFHQQQSRQPEQHVGPVFPLGDTPEDVRPNILSFLPAKELSSIRRVSRGFLQTADLHAEGLWGRLCRRDFPSIAPPPTGARGRERALQSPYQVKS